MKIEFMLFGFGFTFFFMMWHDHNSEFHVLSLMVGNKNLVIKNDAFAWINRLFVGFDISFAQPGIVVHNKRLTFFGMTVSCWSHFLLFNVPVWPINKKTKEIFIHSIPALQYFFDKREYKRKKQEALNRVLTLETLVEAEKHARLSNDKTIPY